MASKTVEKIKGLTAASGSLSPHDNFGRIQPLVNIDPDDNDFNGDDNEGEPTNPLIKRVVNFVVKESARDVEKRHTADLKKELKKLSDASRKKRLEWRCEYISKRTGERCPYPKVKGDKHCKKCRGMLKRMKKAADAKIALANAMEELEIYRISNKSGNSTPFANAALNSDDAPALSSDDADLAQKIKNLTGKQVSEPIPQLPAGTTLTHFKRDPKAAPGKDHEGNLLPPGSLTWDEWIELTNPNRDINDEVNFEYGRWKAHVDEGRESLAKYINNTSKPATNETSTSDFSSEEKPKDPAPMDIDTNKKVYTDEDVKNMISEYARPNGIISKEEVREIKNKTRISKEQMKKNY